MPSSGLLISWAMPAASRPTVVSRSAWKSWRSSSRTRASSWALASVRSRSAFSRMARAPSTTTSTIAARFNTRVARERAATGSTRATACDSGSAHSRTNGEGADQPGASSETDARIAGSLPAARRPARVVPAASFSKHERPGTSAMPEEQDRHELRLEAALRSRGVAVVVERHRRGQAGPRRVDGGAFFAGRARRDPEHGHTPSPSHQHERRAPVGAKREPHRLRVAAEEDEERALGRLSVPEGRGPRSMGQTAQGRRTPRGTPGWQRVSSSTLATARPRAWVSAAKSRVASSREARRAAAMPRIPAPFTAATATTERSVSHPARERSGPVRAGAVASVTR